MIIIVTPKSNDKKKTSLKFDVHLCFDKLQKKFNEDDEKKSKSKKFLNEKSFFSFRILWCKKKEGWKNYNLMNDIKTFNCMGKEIVKQKQLNICVSKKR